jgi:hypothetical protein
MQFSTSSTLAVAMVFIATISPITTTPVPVQMYVHLYISILSKANGTQRVRDLVLIGDLDPSACCSDGVRKGHVNIQGA